MNNNHKSSTNPVFQTINQQSKCLSRCSSPSMFQLLTWPQQYTTKQNQGQNNHEIIQQRLRSNLPPNTQTQKCLQQGQQFLEDNKIKTNVLTQNNIEYDPNRYRLKAHRIQKQLYHNTELKLQKPKSQQQILCNEYFKLKTKKDKPVAIKLNENKPQEKQIIQERKKVIQEFKQNSRELPNSSFTTYYGKPAFQLYGYLSNNQNKKTHNVMPHRQSNNPKQLQTHRSALIKAKSSPHNQSIPKKPLHNVQYIRKPTQQAIDKLESYEKPDLVNNKRFSSPKENTINVQQYCCHPKTNVPSHFSNYKNSSQKKAIFQEKKRKIRQLKRTMSADDGLKYLTKRQGLFNQIQDKKQKKTRLPYKVTECYPQGWPQQSQKNKVYEEYGVTIAAGTQLKHSQSAKNVIYGLN